jgi:hypothetical protein
MKKIIEIINERLSGKEFSCSELENLIQNNPSYRERLEYEAERISDSNPDRSYLNVYKRTLQGHCAEIILLEDEVIGPMLERATKRFHDFYVPSENCFLEVKNFSPATLKPYVQKWLCVDAKQYNTSKYLVVFENRNGKLRLERAIEVEKEIVTDAFSIKKAGKTYTISQKILNILKNDSQLIFEDGEKQVTKSVDWFLRNCKPSKFNNDTFFVFDSML